MIEGLVVTPLKIISLDEGDVMHAIKNSDEGFTAFGEAYFSLINPKSIKGWKMHHEMVCNYCP